MSKGKKAGGGTRAHTSSTQSKLKKASRLQSKDAADRGWFTLRNLLLVLGALAVCGIAVVIPSRWIKYSHFTSPLPMPKVIDTYLTEQTEYKQRLWGSYRSNVYFGMRPRVPRSVIGGLAWMRQSTNPSQPEILVRHTCEHGDGLNKFGWIKHDGATFGQQEIVDGNIILNTDFVVDSQPAVGDSWTARVSAKGDKNMPFSLIFYVYNEGHEALNFTVNGGTKQLEAVNSYTEKIGDFEVKFSSKGLTPTTHGHLVTRLPKIVHFTDFLKHLFQKGSLQLPGEVYLEEMERVPNLVAYQVTGTLPLDLEVTFTSGESLALTGDKFDEVLVNKVNEFDSRFESVFPLKSKGFNDDQISFAKAAFSNLIGGMSYFYGSSYVMNKYTTIKPLRYFLTPLYTAVPSRSFFPRGFLWDEGFHQLLVSRFDNNIAKDALGHWLDLMNVDGWIPREQILGDEALSKVPSEFLVQYNTNGNPPTLFLAFDTLLDQMEKEKQVDTEYLNRVYPRLIKWFSWFNTSQVGPKPLSFRWRGRNSTTDRELNPKTLTSGLDDYPRASHPSDDEYHVDLRCWMVLALKVLYRVSNYIEEDGSNFKEYYDKLTNTTVLDKLHWDNARKVYSDYGNHTTDVKLVINRDVKHPMKVRKVKKAPKLGFVNSFGYVNLFPLLMNLIPPDSPKLAVTLDHLRNESLLWSKYGLRSVGKHDPFYGKSNTEHDNPYWRGAIWININYLTVKALHYYGITDGPYKEQSLKIYKQLRSNLITNLFKEYQKTGYIWEQYNDKTGSGKGTHPFTGWSSLIVLIMAEQY